MEDLKASRLAELIQASGIMFLVMTRASAFTRVNGSVSCLCNKRLQNWPTV